jgi:hypothetical protein
MPRQNRVLPTGQIVADPARGLFTGNRGCIHDAEGRIRRRWTTKAWICCRLEWKGVRRALMTPGRWTELFFLDEAVALAAGHRPCAYCRRADFNRFREAWGGGPKAPEMDAALHAARTGIRPEARIEDLPDGAFVEAGGRIALWHGRRLLCYTPGGYGGAVEAAGQVTLLTPLPMVAILRNGYVPALHPSAEA